MSPTGPHDLAALAQAAGAIAQRAARAILEVYEAPFTVTSKDDRSPLTAADLAANELIVGALRELTPQLPVLSEESSSVAWHERSRWSSYWLVDPLDGTREFIKRNGEFTVNIALIEQHQPVLGVVQTPVTSELACAWRGGGAWLSNPARAAAPRRIHTRVRAATPVVAGSRSHASAREADLYLRLGPTSEWDTAAGQCVLEQAGGAVLDWQGQRLRYNARDSLINGDFLALGDPGADWRILLE